MKAIEHKEEGRSTFEAVLVNTEEERDEVASLLTEFVVDEVGMFDLFSEAEVLLGDDDTGQSFNVVVWPMRYIGRICDYLDSNLDSNCEDDIEIVNNVLKQIDMKEFTDFVTVRSVATLKSFLNKKD